MQAHKNFVAARVHRRDGLAVLRIPHGVIAAAHRQAVHLAVRGHDGGFFRRVVVLGRVADRKLHRDFGNGCLDRLGRGAGQALAVGRGDLAGVLVLPGVRCRQGETRLRRARNGGPGRIQPLVGIPNPRSRVIRLGGKDQVAFVIGSAPLAAGVACREGQAGSLQFPGGGKGEAAGHGGVKRIGRAVLLPAGKAIAGAGGVRGLDDLAALQNQTGGQIAGRGKAHLMQHRCLHRALGSRAADRLKVVGAGFGEGKGAGGQFCIGCAVGGIEQRSAGRTALHLDLQFGLGLLCLQRGRLPNLHRRRLHIQVNRPEKSVGAVADPIGHPIVQIPLVRIFGGDGNAPLGDGLVLQFGIGRNGLAAGEGRLYRLHAAAPIRYGKGDTQRGGMPAAGDRGGQRDLGRFGVDAGNGKAFPGLIARMVGEDQEIAAVLVYGKAVAGNCDPLFRADRLILNPGHAAAAVTGNGPLRIVQRGGIVTEALQGDRLGLIGPAVGHLHRRDIRGRGVDVVDKDSRFPGAAPPVNGGDGIQAVPAHGEAAGGVPAFHRTRVRNPVQGEGPIAGLAGQGPGEFGAGILPALGRAGKRDLKLTRRGRLQRVGAGCGCNAVACLVGGTQMQIDGPRVLGFGIIGEQILPVHSIRRLPDARGGGRTAEAVFHRLYPGIRVRYRRGEGQAFPRHAALVRLVQIHHRIHPVDLCHLHRPGQGLLPRLQGKGIPAVLGHIGTTGDRLRAAVRPGHGDRRAVRGIGKRNGALLRPAGVCHRDIQSGQHGIRPAREGSGPVLVCGCPGGAVLRQDMQIPGAVRRLPGGEGSAALEILPTVHRQGGVLGPDILGGGSVLHRYLRAGHAAVYRLVCDIDDRHGGIHACGNACAARRGDAFFYAHIPDISRVVDAFEGDGSAGVCRHGAGKVQNVGILAPGIAKLAPAGIQ